MPPVPQIVDWCESSYEARKLLNPIFPDQSAEGGDFGLNGHLFDAIYGIKA